MINILNCYNIANVISKELLYYSMENQYCDMCQKETKGQLFPEGYGNLVCAKCNKIAQRAEAYREQKDRQVDCEVFEQMSPAEQRYQISLGWGTY